MGMLQPSSVTRGGWHLALHAEVQLFIDIHTMLRKAIRLPAQCSGSSRNSCNTIPQHALPQMPCRGRSDAPHGGVGRERVVGHVNAGSDLVHRRAALHEAAAVQQRVAARPQVPGAAAIANLLCSRSWASS